MTNKGTAVATNVDLGAYPAGEGSANSDFYGPSSLAPGETRMVEIVASKNVAVNVQVTRDGTDADQSDNHLEIDFSRRRSVRRG
jgi:hypothetical protein